jgi:RNA polymerase-binding transcription factor DksA
MNNTRDTTLAFFNWMNNHRVDNPADSTHFSYAGGKYLVPDAENDTFLRLYARELQCTENKKCSRLFLIEKKTHVFRMHFDLDMIQELPVTLVEATELAKLFCSVFATYYPGVSTQTFVCYVHAAPVMEKRGWPDSRGNTPMVVKSGFHFMWPYLLVDQQQSLYLREGCIYAAKLKFGERVAPANPFADAIDETVLRKNGLRLVGSDKLEQCSLCGTGSAAKRPSGKCDLCGGARKVPENRVYLPVFVLNAAQQVDANLLSRVLNQDDYFDRVNLCTVRSCVGVKTAGFVVPEFAAIPVALPSDSKVARAPLTSEDRESARSRSMTARALTAGDSEEIDTGSQLFSMVNDFIHDNQRMGGDQWEFVVLKKLFLLKTFNRYLAKVSGGGAHFCTNVGRQHNSSSVYFIIDYKGFTQRCFSKKQAVGGKVPCYQYVSPVIKLPLLLKMALFATEEAFMDEEVVTPVNGYVDTAKQMYAVDATRKLLAIEKKRKLAPVVEVKPTLAKTGSSRQYDLSGDFTSREINQMKCRDLIDHDRRKLQEMHKTVQEVQAQSFVKCAAPTLEKTGARKKRNKPTK